jgi:hypothetical protein
MGLHMCHTPWLTASHQPVRAGRQIQGLSVSAPAAWLHSKSVTGYHTQLNAKPPSLLQVFMLNHVSVASFRSQSVQCLIFVPCFDTADLFYLLGLRYFRNVACCTREITIQHRTAVQLWVCITSKVLRQHYIRWTCSFILIFEQHSQNPISVEQTLTMILLLAVSVYWTQFW